MIELQWWYVPIFLSVGAMIGVALFGLLASRHFNDELTFWKDKAMLYKDRAEKVEVQLRSERTLPKVLDYLVAEMERESKIRDDKGVPDAELQHYFYHDGIRHGLVRALLHIKALV